MTDFTQHKLSETERENIISICTTELLRLYKTDTDLNSRINHYLNTKTDNNEHEAVKDNIANCYTIWNINRLNDDDLDAAISFVAMANRLAEQNIRFEYDILTGYTDEEQYSSPFTAFTHIIILISWCDWDKLCKEIMVYHFKEVIDLVKKSSTRHDDWSDLLKTLLPKGD